MAPEIYFTNIGIKINELSNIAFKIGNLKIYWYGLIIVSAILIGYFMIDRTLKKEGSSIDEYLNFIIIVIGQIISLFWNAIQRFSMSLYLLEFTGITEQTCIVSLLCNLFLELL